MTRNDYTTLAIAAGVFALGWLGAGKLTDSGWIVGVGVALALLTLALTIGARAARG